MENVTVKMIKLSEILKKQNPRNPESRVRNVSALAHKIAAEGYDPIYPLVLGTDDLIGDGHRRLRASETAEITEIPVVRHTTKTADQIFSDNQVNSSIKSFEWMEAHIAGLSQELIPKGIWGKIDYLKKIGGDKLLREMREKRQGPQLADVAKRVVRATKLEDKKIVFWMMKHAQQALVRSCLDQMSRVGYLKKVMKDHIEADNPLPIEIAEAKYKR